MAPPGGAGAAHVRRAIQSGEKTQQVPGALAAPPPIDRAFTEAASRSTTAVGARGDRRDQPLQERV